MLRLDVGQLRVGKQIRKFVAVSDLGTLQRRGIGGSGLDNIERIELFYASGRRVVRGITSIAG
ncbi:hypothetical protein HMP06_1537 [Sphingomonas sp. HMP6]|nr:hypothetical protein HMP06_1537 [Sphingomonas sp. HMP6]